MKSPSAAVISELAGTVNAWKNQQREHKDLRIAVDVDPFDML